MKKIIAGMLVVAFILSVAMPVQAEESIMKGEGRGGVMGFIAGCCFGIRAGSDYNDGKEVHWREWVTLVPFVNIIFHLWNGVEGAQGVTRAQYAEQYGSIYY